MYFIIRDVSAHVEISVVVYIYSRIFSLARVGCVSYSWCKDVIHNRLLIFLDNYFNRNMAYQLDIRVVDI